jgi:uncharacterized membrane protein YadS
LVVACGVSLLCVLANRLLGLTGMSPMILGVTAGLLLNWFFGVADVLKPGLIFCVRPVLRMGIARLGFQITAAQIFELGLSGLGVLFASAVAAFLVSLWLGSITRARRPARAAHGCRHGDLRCVRDHC